MDPREKMRTKYHFHRPGVDAFNTAKIGHGNSQKPQVHWNTSMLDARADNPVFNPLLLYRLETLLKQELFLTGNYERLKRQAHTCNIVSRFRKRSVYHVKRDRSREGC